jgi:hypothetical protein
MTAAATVADRARSPEMRARNFVRGNFAGVSRVANWFSGAVWAAAIVTTLTAPVRAAEQRDEVIQLLRQGVELRKQGKEQQSLPLLQRAYQLSRTPQTAGLLGLSEMAVGQGADAERHLSEALATPSDPWVTENNDVLTQALTRLQSEMGEVIVAGGPRGAELRVNGTDVGQLPLKEPLRIPEGPVTVELRKAGYLTASRSIMVRGGQREEVIIGLPRAQNEAEPAGSSANRLTLQPSDENAPMRDDSFSRRSALRTGAWAALAGAAVAGGLAAWQTTVWSSKQRDFDNHVGERADDPTVVDRNCSSSEPGRGGPGCAAIYDDLRKARTLSIVGYAAAGALAVGSIVLFTVSSHAESGGSAVSLSCTALPAPGASCRLTF